MSAAILWGFVLALCFVAQAQAALSHRDLVGSWAGETEEWGTAVEFRVDAIDPDGRVSGARCVRWPAWMDTIIPFDGMGAVTVRTSHGRPAIEMALIAEHVRDGVVGDEAVMRLDLVDPKRLDYTAVPTVAGVARGSHPGGAVLWRVDKLPCLDRYSPVPGTIAAPSPVLSGSPVGYWSIVLSAGKTFELVIGRVDRSVVRGRFCVFVPGTAAIKLVDLSAFPDLPAVYDAPARTMTFERRRVEMDSRHNRRPRTDRFVFAFNGAEPTVASIDESLALSLTMSHGTPRATTRTFAFVRGLQASGCLARVLPEGYVWSR